MGSRSQFCLFAVFFALALSACGGGGGSTPAGDPISIRAPSTKVMEGDTLALTADTDVAPLTWRSSDTRIASVSAEGQVIGCQEGPVTISVEGPGPERGSIDLRVIADRTFNLSLPASRKDLTPTLERDCSIPGCEVSLNLTGIGAAIRRENYRPYHRLQLPQSGALAVLGKPELPFYTLYFAIPVDSRTHEPAAWSVSVSRESPLTYEGIRPWPHQPPRGSAADPAFDEDVPPFAVDEQFYASSEAWPEITHRARAIHAGNLPVLEVKVIPAQYTPATMTLALFQTTRVRVSFETSGELSMPCAIGDYKGIEETGADAYMVRVAQNGDLIDVVGAGDLLEKVPPFEAGGRDMPFDMLILTRPSLEAPARRLAEWRQSQDTRVWVAVCDEVKYPDADSLLTLIHDLDELNRLDVTGEFRPHAMRAICLFGDVEHIPTWEGLNQRNANLPGPDDGLVPIVGTDLPYSTLRGLDWVSDVALGRISIDNAPEGHAVVAKIEEYEQLPDDELPHHASVWGLFDDRPHERVVLPGEVRFTQDSAYVVGRGTHWENQIHVNDVIRPSEGQPARDGPWHARVLRVIQDDIIELVDPWGEESITHAAGLQVGHQDGRADWGLVKGTERIRRFLLGHHVDVKYGYVREERPPVAPAPTHGYLGDPLPSDLISYAWDADEVEITNRWNLGLDGIVLYCGHGKPTSWRNPVFGVSAVEALGPKPTGAGPWYPIVLSMCCHSGFFDSETDRVYLPGTTEPVETTGTDGYGTHTVSFCEQVLREPSGGGIAAIGGSRGLDSGKNDRLIDGLFGAFYSYYAEGAALGGPITWEAFEYLGDAVRAGKYTMHSWMLTPTPGRNDYNSDDALYPMQAIHLFGDPMLKMRLPVRPTDPD